MSVGSDLSELHASLVRPKLIKPARLATVCTILFILEFISVAVAAHVASLGYQYAAYAQFETTTDVYGALFLAALVSVISLGFRQFVGIQRQPLHALLWSGMGAVALAFAFFLSALFLLKFSGEYSRGAFVFQFLAVAFAVCAVRVTFYVWLQSAIRRGAVEARKVILIGDERYRSQFTDLVKSTGFQSIASLPFPHHRSIEPEDDFATLVDLKAARQLIDFCRSGNPDDIVILSSQDELAAAPELARLLSELPVNVHIVPLGTVNIFGTSRIAELGDLKTLQVSRPPLSPLERAVKRAFDIVAAVTGLILLAPLFAIVSIAIKLESPGPIFFRQKRHGYNYTTIDVVKFRTMFVTRDTNFVQTKREDVRVTQVGRILRRTNIDEPPSSLTCWPATCRLSVLDRTPQLTIKCSKEQSCPYIVGTTSSRGLQVGLRSVAIAERQTRSRRWNAA